MSRYYDNYKISFDREQTPQNPPSEIPGNPGPVQRPIPEKATIWFDDSL